MKPARKSHSLLRALLFGFIGLALGLSACQPASATPPAATATYSPQATSAAGLVDEGDERLALSDFAGAANAYQKALEADPEFAPAYSHLSYTHLFNPETREAALDEARKATDLAPDSATAWAYLARAQDWNGQFEAARESGEKAAQLDANDADVQSFLAEVYADLRMYDEAEVAAEQAVKLDPNNAEARRNLGYYYSAVSRQEDALAQWQAAYDLQPQFVPRLTSIAIYYLYLRPDPAEARKWLTDALAVAPDDITALQFLARLDSNAGDLEAAQAGCDRILAIAPNSPDGHNCKASVQSAAGDYETAETERLAAIEADPDDETGYAGLGYVYFAMNNCRKAVDQFKKAIELKPRSGSNYAGLGLAQLCGGDQEAAIEAYEKAIELEPRNGDHHLGLGQIYMQQADLNAAEREMQAAVEIDPGSDQFAIWLGRVYAAQGETDKAIEQYTQAVALNPNDGGNAAALGFAYLGTGDYDQAAETFQEAIEVYAAHGGSTPSIAEANYGLGLAQVALEDCAAAAPPLQKALQLNPQLTDAQGYLAACRRSAGLADTPLPPALTANGPLGPEGAVQLLNDLLPSLGVQAQAGFDQVNGEPVMVIVYAASVPPNDPSFIAEQSPVVYAGAWALARQTGLINGLVVAALDPDGNLLSTVIVRREHALWWTQGILDDDAFAGLWLVNTATGS